MRKILKIYIYKNASLRCGVGGQSDFISVNTNDCQMFYIINRPWFFTQDKLMLFCSSCMCAWVHLHPLFFVFVRFKPSPVWQAWGLCTNVAPVRPILYLILLVAVFVCVVPVVQPVLSVRRYSITGSLVFRCAQVSPCCDLDVCISQCPPPSDNVLSVSDRASASCPQSFSFDTHTRQRSE